MRLNGLLALLLAASTVPSAAAATAPVMPITSFEQLARPLPLPYDEKANADRAIDRAMARAARGRKLLLIDLGGNWCLDCRILAGTMETVPLKAWLAQHFEIVIVDVGRFDKNMQVPARFGVTGRLQGVPAVLIVDPRRQRLINVGRITALADARSMNPQSLADWFARWVN